MTDGQRSSVSPTLFAALSIVHEATHARLAAIATTVENINRIERICVTQELAFAERLPGSGPLQDWLRERLVQIGEMDFTLKGSAERGLAALERDGTPKVMMAAMRRMARHAVGE